MPQLKVLFTCVVCGKAWDKKQSLRAHLKVHKDVVFKDFHVRLPKDMVLKFEDVCKKHKTTTCSLINTLMMATVKGEELGVIHVGTPNPAIVQVNTFVAAKPRGHGKYYMQEVSKRMNDEVLKPLLGVPKHLWPPSCSNCDEYFRWVEKVGCLKVKDWVPLQDCWRCFLTGENVV